MHRFSLPSSRFRASFRDGVLVSDGGRLHPRVRVTRREHRAHLRRALGRRPDRGDVVLCRLGEDDDRFQSAAADGAGRDANVLLADFDLRRPSVSQFMALRGAAGVRRLVDSTDVRSFLSRSRRTERGRVGFLQNAEALERKECRGGAGPRGARKPRRPLPRVRARSSSCRAAELDGRKRHDS